MSIQSLALNRFVIMVVLVQIQCSVFTHLCINALFYQTGILKCSLSHASTCMCTCMYACGHILQAISLAGCLYAMHSGQPEMYSCSVWTTMVSCKFDTRPVLYKASWRKYQVTAGRVAPFISTAMTTTHWHKGRPITVEFRRVGHCFMYFWRVRS